MSMEQWQRRRKDSMLIIFPAPVLFQSQWGGGESDHPGSITIIFLRSPGPLNYTGVLVLIEFCPLTPGLLVEELKTS